MTLPRFLHVTGMGRSGTTLVDKLLGGHPRLSVLSQPFPLLFVDAKRRFLASQGLPPAAHPLSHYFDEPYTVERLGEFLSALEYSADEVRECFAEMEGYSGRWHRPDDLQQRLTRSGGGPFEQTLRQLLAALSLRPDSAWLGSKEIHTEEFLPWLLERGWRCLLVLRDPRDVVASYNCGRGADYGGEPRPTLFHVRNWRKSVAFHLLLDGRPGYLGVRYEDLVADPCSELGRMYRFLEVEDRAATVLEAPLRDQQGRPWSSNSSHRTEPGVSDASVGRFRSLLDPDVAAFIEATCLPEMQCLGYPVRSDAARREEILRSFRESQPVRSAFPADYSSSDEHLRQEQSRLAAVESGPSDDSSRWFLSPEVHRKLHVAWQDRPGPTPEGGARPLRRPRRS